MIYYIYIYNKKDYIIYIYNIQYDVTKNINKYYDHRSLK